MTPTEQKECSNCGFSWPGKCPICSEELTDKEVKKMAPNPIEAWDAMTDREQDAWIAEHVIGHKLGWFTDYGFKKEYECLVIALENSRYDHISHYSTDISAVMEAEEKIMQMDKVKYTTALLAVLKIDDWKITPDAAYKLVHASAADRCKAMWKTINDINGKEEGK